MNAANASGVTPAAMLAARKKAPPLASLQSAGWEVADWASACEALKVRRSAVAVVCGGVEEWVQREGGDNSKRERGVEEARASAQTTTECVEFAAAAPSPASTESPDP